ncbi:EF-hand domain-containing protein [Streptomyces virginiae]|nr:EF-hand domain-containing protein [Streptomyces virginiae]MCX4960157.1 EF-hand domain-containing protein [Streptomyces virginiae]
MAARSRRHGRHRRDFKRIDTDGKGSLSIDELCAAVKAHEGTFDVSRLG